MNRLEKGKKKEITNRSFARKFTEAVELSAKPKPKKKKKEKKTQRNLPRLFLSHKQKESVPVHSGTELHSALFFNSTELARGFLEEVLHQHVHQKQPIFLLLSLLSMVMGAQILNSV
jgi:hypothetical protein